MLKPLKNLRIKLTNNCQLHCRHCYNTGYNNTNTISDHVFDQVLVFLSQLPNKQDYRIILHGGEPFLYDCDRIDQLIDFCIQQQFTAVSACTNLVYKIDDKMLNLLSKLYDRRLTSTGPVIETSWDYNIRFDNQKQLALWERNVQSLISRNIIPEVSITLTNQLIEHLSPIEVYRYVSSLGIQYVQFERLLVCGRASIDLVPETNKLAKWLAIAVEQKPQNISVRFFDEINDGLQGNYHGCIGRQCYDNQFTIDVDGTIYGCPVDYIHKRGSIFDGIQPNKHQFNMIDCIPSQCIDCQYANVCKGDCYLVNNRCTLKPLFDVINKQFN